jgi:hypothetical protein
MINFPKPQLFCLLPFESKFVVFFFEEITYSNRRSSNDCHINKKDFLPFFSLLSPKHKHTHNNRYEKLSKTRHIHTCIAVGFGILMALPSPISIRCQHFIHCVYMYKASETLRCSLSNMVVMINRRLFDESTCDQLQPLLLLHYNFFFFVV